LPQAVERLLRRLLADVGGLLNLPGNDLAGVRYLRSLEDSKTLRTHAASAKRALVIGGGFIGMEVASVLAQKGVSTTIVLPEDRI
jgi:3-phenylpropionate/trans-cinnamate dioxygenase ferredoxin reductase subunit